MQVESLIAFLFVGAVSGWLAGKLMRGGGFGLIINIVVGVIGALIGGYIFNVVGISAGGIIGSIVIATVGAGVFLFVADLVRRK
ncbi:MAG TPA: GlsB/YeaQ/YmgE family stress response membrane protein [Woeseiaceae bacterium]|nr:GlsB/YeaQ/YmgE family stress response membrane protein [Woeseiaceae bacterium]